MGEILYQVARNDQIDPFFKGSQTPPGKAVNIFVSKMDLKRISICLEKRDDENWMTIITKIYYKHAVILFFFPCLHILFNMGLSNI